jgi:protoporphyrinogen oxidase
VRVAVLGAGVAGLVAAYRLACEGHACDVYERWPGLGGQAATLDVGDGHLLERYYHHLFKSDKHIQELCVELGLDDEIEWLPSSVAIFSRGALHPFTSPLDVLRFKPLSLRARFRMGLAVTLLQRRHREVTPFEDIPAHEWVKRNMGQEVWDTVWGPLLRQKFSHRAEDLSMAWLWSKFTLRRQIKGEQTRTELLGYPRTSFERLFQRLREEIERRAGRVLVNRPAARLGREGHRLAITPGAPDSFRRGHDPRLFETPDPPEHYDAVVATVPSDVFTRLLTDELAAEVGQEYLGRLGSIEYHAALCMLLELDRRLTPFYWSNIADDGFPFIGLIEHTNFVEPARYGGRRFAYIANYVPRDDPLLQLDPNELLATYEPFIRRLNPKFSCSWIRRQWLFREPAAQPVVTVGYQRRVPPLKTGVPGLFLANTSQVYPEDRGTNYAVRLGEQVAVAVNGQLERGELKSALTS